MERKSIKIAFSILGKRWTLRILTKRGFKRRYKNALAVTLGHKRRIDLGPSGTDLETIIHELVHAYSCELCLSSTNCVAIEDFEEIFAEFVAKRGQELLDKATSLHTPVQNVTNT